MPVHTCMPSTVVCTQGAGCIQGMIDKSCFYRLMWFSPGRNKVYTMTSITLPFSFLFSCFFFCVCVFLSTLLLLFGRGAHQSITDTHLCVSLDVFLFCSVLSDPTPVFPPSCPSVCLSSCVFCDGPPSDFASLAVKSIPPPSLSLTTDHLSSLRFPAGEEGGHSIGTGFTGYCRPSTLGPACCHCI